jgi:hypothetical protein
MIIAQGNERKESSLSAGLQRQNRHAAAKSLIVTTITHANTIPEDRFIDFSNKVCYNRPK